MKSSEFIRELEKRSAMKSKYKLGTFMNKKEDGYYLCDCSGLIKACFWGYPNGEYKSNGLGDINANTMIKRCTKTSTNFDDIVEGAIVWLSGHIGVYVGNGYVIECTPKWNGGIQKVKLSARNWTKWGLFQYIEYDTQTNTKTEKATGKYTVKVSSALIVRTGPGTNHARKSKTQLTADGQKHSNAYGGLLNGTHVSVLKWQGKWARIASGWVYGDYLVEGWI